MEAARAQPLLLPVYTSDEAKSGMSNGFIWVPTTGKSSTAD